jgi:hypothetical protein
MAKRKTSGGEGLAVRAPDRSSCETAAQRNHILERAAADAELRMELDGQLDRTPLGFNAETDSRRMFIPYRVTTCPATALAICKARGLLASKLDAMTADASWAVYLMHLAPDDFIDN